MFDYRTQQKNQTGPAADIGRTRVDSIKTVLAEAYVPAQPFEAIYPPEQALIQGTVFRELDKPYMKGGHMKRPK